MERFRGGEQDLLTDVLDGPLLGVHQRGYMLGELVAGGQHELPRVRLPVSLHGGAVCQWRGCEALTLGGSEFGMKYAHIWWRICVK